MGKFPLSRLIKRQKEELDSDTKVKLALKYTLSE